jgi:hypothetical protein
LLAVISPRRRKASSRGSGWASPAAPAMNWNSSGQPAAAWASSPSPSASDRRPTRRGPRRRSSPASRSPSADRRQLGLQCERFADHKPVPFVVKSRLLTQHKTKDLKSASFCQCHP